MTRIFSLLVSFVVFVTSQDPGQVFETIGHGIQKELVAIKQPIEETIVSVGSSQCNNVKKLFGVSYEQLKGEREPDLNGLSLFYRTRSFTTVYNISDAPNSLLETRALYSWKKIVIFIHGFTDDPTKDSFTNISISVLESDEGSHITLLALDCSSLIRWLYLRSTTYIIFIGQKLAAVLVALVHSGVDPSQIHIVGHSLGAHIAGFTGKQFYSLTGQKLGRITGLDPAGPCFVNVDDDHRLNEYDAIYVDIIHTDGGVFGIKSPVGQSDYYPNDGVQQPDCFWQTCSHSRSWLLFAESVLRELAFPAIRCDSWEAFKKGQCYKEISYMGYASKPGTRGLFFLQTRGKYPYGLGLEGIKYSNKLGIVRNVQEAIEGAPGVKNLTEVLGNVPVIKSLPIFG